MSLLNISVAGGAWVTASGIGRMNGGDDFSMPDGALPRLRRELLSSRLEQRWGRLDYYSKAGLVAASLAMKDAGLNSRNVPSSTAIVASTACGCIDVDHDYYRTVVPDNGLLASPNLFAYTLPSCMLGEISIRYGLTGPAMVVSQATPDMINGLVVGAKLISYGLCEKAIAGYCDTETGIRQVDTVCKPGAVFLILEKAEEESSLVFDGSELTYDGRTLYGLIDLMEQLACNKQTELQR